MIRLDNVSYTYPRTGQAALRDLTLTIGENEFVAIMGRNGSGKSTLARLLNGLLLPTTGRVEVDSMFTDERASLAKLRERVGLLFPLADNQFIAGTVEDDVAFGPENLGLSQQEIRIRVDTALEMVSMEDYKKCPPNLLSGGQKQKVCLAGLLALRPGYMVLDEPGAMLDSMDCQKLMLALLDLNHNFGIGIILITYSKHRLVSLLSLIPDLNLRTAPKG